jgi:tetratricopeptide (TPR) repeat protein
MITVLETSPGSWLFEHHLPEGADEQFESVLDLFESNEYLEAEKRIKALLLVCPDHIDALHHLGLLYSYTGRPLEAYLATREAVRIGMDALPPAFSWLTSSLAWGHFENRPFMRACHSLGLHILRTQGSAAALELFARLVSVNPNDNLGARYVLMGCWLETGAWQSAISLALRYPDDAGPDIAYSKAVAQVHVADYEGATESLRFALQCKPNIAAEILKTKHIRPPQDRPGYMTLGGEDEAFDYWERNRSHWAKSSEVFKLLKQLLKNEV